MRRLMPLLFPALAFLTPQPVHNAPADWNPTAAAAYLDQRMDEWFDRGEKLRTGTSQTTCVSCHTVIPYALARPALRRAMGIASPTSQEMRLAAETSRRVDTTDTDQLLYDFDDDKKGESRGTEAVLYALILASADGGQSRREPSEATRRAMTRLGQAQRADGGWEWLDVGLEPFESIDSAYQGAAFAALAVGMSRLTDGPTAQAGIAKLRDYLRSHYPDQTLHNQVWGLLASTFLIDVLSDAARNALIEQLERRRNDDGGWSLDGLGAWRWNRTTPPFASPGTRDRALVTKSDGYATGLIVYALRRAGMPVEHPAVDSGLRWLKAHQQPVEVGERSWSAWRAHSLNYDREHGGARGEPWRRLFMSDAATGFASLALIPSAAE
jgi:squalene-hopene/tetraprenyl-beta-curcumene cyclase